VELFDDVRDRVAYAGYFAKTPLRDNLVEWKAQREQTVCRARVGFRAKRIAAPERAPLSEFSEQSGNCGCIRRSHLGQCARA
jgi:hypothetical protein